MEGDVGLYFSNVHLYAANVHLYAANVDLYAANVDLWKCKGQLCDCKDVRLPFFAYGANPTASGFNFFARLGADNFFNSQTKR